MHKPLSGETRQLPAQEAGDFVLIGFEYPGGLSLREPPRSNRLGYPDCEGGLGETLSGVGQANIGQGLAV